MSNGGVKVFAPASVANLSVGFDLIGLALEHPGDEIIIRKGIEKGLTISKITGDNGQLPLSVEKNTAGFSALSLLSHLGLEDEAIEMEIHKKMPFNSGLGSSAASAVAGAMAVNEYLGRPLKKQELLPFAVLGEKVADGAMHGDNVAPSLLGGIIAVQNLAENKIIQLPVPKGLFVGIVHIDIPVPTKEARGILSSTVSLSDHVRQSAYLASFISSLYTSDFHLLSQSIKDVIIEPQRQHLIPFYQELKNIALDKGAVGFGISGAGPSVFLLGVNSLTTEEVVEKLKSFLFGKSIVANGFISKVNLQGAFRY